MAQPLPPHKMMRWLLFPSALIFFLLFFSDVNRSRDYIPKFAPFSESSHGTSHSAKAIQDVWVDGVDSAIKVGMEYTNAVHSRCFTNETNGRAEREEECKGIFARLKVLTGIRANDINEFANLTKLNVRDSSQSALQRAAGFLSLTNVLFVIGALIVVSAAVPAFAVILGIFGPLLWEIVSRILILLKPFYEPLSYLISFFIIQQAWHYHDSMTNLIAFFGGLIAVGAFVYSTLLHASTGSNNYRAFSTVLGSYTFIIFSIIALQYNSSFLGFIAICGLFAALGFSVIPFGLGVSIGFRDEDVMETCAVTSFFFIVVSIVISNFFPPDWKAWLYPFKFGIFTMGATVYFLATLIISSNFYKRQFYMMRQLMFLFPLFAFFSIGMILNMPALVNTSGAFLFLYGLEKLAELFSRSKDWAWVWMFVGGSILLYSAFFLRTHPDIVVSIFSAYEVID
eukprot:TRINITY_DN5624_c0_g1_i1.p1 TRINITY_DN5624_c0_g1~~TRINITY_DN5624_c0_g1_i1.p1  ORF type:complete len:454 (+),score=143.40 TRINITY_DN5624_c0_g1_i1:188-1549(+)